MVLPAVFHCVSLLMVSFEAPDRRRAVNVS